MSVPVVSFLRAAHCWGWSAPCVQRQTPATTKLSYPSSFSSSTASSFCLLQLFPLPLKSVCLYPSTCHPFPFPKLLSTRCIPSVSHPLSYFLTLSHTHSSVFRLLPFCPSPSLLIRAICWRGRQSDLRMDRIVLYVESVVQCWSQSCAYMRGNVAHMLVFV